MGIRHFTFGPSVVFTNGTGSYVLFAMTPAIDTTRVHHVRPAIEMCNSTGDITMVAGYELSNDQLTWTGTATIQIAGPAPAVSLTANGTDHGTEWVDLDALIQDYAYIRFGIQVKNTSGSDNELCLASLRLDHRSH